MLRIKKTWPRWFSRPAWRVMFIAAALSLGAAVPGLALQGRVNINTAGMEELQRLPFIGAEKAGAIIEYRRKKPFAGIDELLEIPDIGRSTFEAVKPYLKLQGASTLHQEDTAASSPGPVSSPDIQDHTRLTAYSIISSRPGDIRVLPDGEYYHTLIEYINTARKRIDVAMFLFKITESHGNLARKTLNALIAAEKRGVDVRVILEKSNFDDNLNRENTRTARLLQRNGVTVIFDSPGVTSHEKMVVIDRRYSFIGSHNLTHSALARNHEFSLLIDSRQLAKALADYMTDIQP